jgi:aspartyl-tRNA(Asn)/glutamyl-tRNA(Gln) amidotransferase subunit C
MLTKEEVAEIAFLARLRLGEDEAERLRGDLSQILDYVEELRGLDTEGIEPMTHAVPMDCPLREDVVSPSLSADEALAEAPEREEDYFVVPRVVDK